MAYSMLGLCFRATEISNIINPILNMLTHFHGSLAQGFLGQRGESRNIDSAEFDSPLTLPVS